MSSQRTKRRKVQQDVAEMLAEINCTISNTNINNALVSSYRGAVVNVQPINNYDCSSDYGIGICYKNCEVEDNVNQTNVVPVDVKLADWAITHNITGVALDNLLGILQPHIKTVNLPKCSRTLLKTPTKYNIVNICGGQFYYFGIRQYLQKLKIGDFTSFGSLNILNVTIGVDGIPISDSSTRQFWPLLLYFDDTKDRRPCLIALFFGLKKPNSVHDYFESFTSEFNEINNSGFNLLGRNIYINIRCVIADAPARSFLKCTAVFNAYSGCDRCVDKGTYLGRVIFTELNAEKRTQESFVNQLDADHHSTVSPLLNLNVDPVSEVVLDYMHLVCLGVTRKLLHAWCKGPRPFKLSPTTLQIISVRLIKLRKYVPCEFNRKPRSLFELNNWKATELRTFLLYLGPSVLHSLLDEKKYKHFLNLSVAMRILLSENAEWYNVARELLRNFVQDTPVLYEEEWLVYNVHSLIHLADDAEKFGSLDLISAFKFENYMQSLKRMVRAHKNELSQVVRRVYEKEHVLYRQAGNRSNLGSKSKLENYRKSGNDCFVLKNGDLVKIVDKIGDLVHIRKFTTKHSISWGPVPSHKLGIYKVGKLSVIESICKYDDIARKVMLLPWNIDNPVNDYIVLPLCSGDQ